AMSEELQYLLVVVGLFLVPGVLQRFRIPGPITCVALGLLLGAGFQLFHTDSTLPMLGTLGIVSLFLFAGMEVDFSELRRGAAVVAMIAVLPFVFRGFVGRVLPFAPRSEFAFLVILALICAYVTRLLGVYYLVGAFVVGLTAVRLKDKLPALASERLLVGIEL